MSLEAWGDEGLCGPDGYVTEESHNELQTAFDDLRKAARAVVEAPVYEGGEKANGISLALVAAMRTLLHELLIHTPLCDLSAAEQETVERVMEERRAALSLSRETGG